LPRLDRSYLKSIGTLLVRRSLTNFRRHLHWSVVVGC
jgi:hypothetical protein